MKNKCECKMYREAIKDEKSGVAFYKRLKKKTGKKSLRGVIADEKRHLKMMKKLSRARCR